MKPLVAMALSALSLMAQTAPPPAGPVSGIVLDQASGEPVGRAQVSLVRISPEAPAGGTRVAVREQQESLPVASALAATDGRFRLDGVAPGVYTVRVRRSGYYAGASNAIEVRAGAAPAPVTIRLTAQNAVSGVVVDGDGEPVEGAMVQLLQMRRQRGVQWSVLGVANTDDRGAFRITTPATGDVYVAAQPSQQLPSTSAPGSVYISTFYPSAVELKEAKSVDLRSGGAIGNITVKLRAGRVFTVRGRVTGADGKPVRQASIQVIAPDKPLGGNGLPARFNSEDGAFEVSGVTTGKYRVIAVAIEDSKQSSAAAEIVVTDRDITNFELRVLPPVTVSGTVDIPLPPMPAGGPTDIVPVEGIETRPQVRVGLNPTAWDGIARSYTAQVKEDGTFTIEGVQPGSYEVAAGFQYGAYLASVLVDNREVLGKPLEINTSIDKLHLTYKADGGTLRAVMQGQKPAGVQTPLLAIVPVDASLRRPPFLYVFQMSMGREATIPRLRPGDYYVWIFDRFQSYDRFDDPGFVKQLESAARRVRIEPDGDHTAEMPLTRWP